MSRFERLSCHGRRSGRRKRPAPPLSRSGHPTLLVHGKGRRQRLAYLGMNGAAEAMAAWLAIWGEDAKRAAMSTAKASRAAKQSFKNR